MSNRDTSIDPRLLESARKEFMEKGFIKAELKTICENAIDNCVIPCFMGFYMKKMQIRTRKSYRCARGNI